MPTIHPTALVSPHAAIGRDVSIGPYVIVEHGVEIGDRCRLAGHAIVKEGTTLGPDNDVHEAAILGGLAQYLTPDGPPGRIAIGSGNTFREHSTAHRSLKEDGTTVIGDNNFLMGNVHVAHDCRIGNHTIMANNVMLAGHVTVQDHAFLSGSCGVHQFCRIGAYAMVGGQAVVVQDVAPYVTVDGLSSRVVGLNTIGLRRNGFTRDQIMQLKAAYRVIYRSGLTWREVLERLAAEFTEGPAVALHEFLSTTQRGFVQERRASAASTLKIHRDDEPTEVRKAG